MGRDLRRRARHLVGAGADLDEVLADPQVHAAGGFVEVPDGDGDDAAPRDARRLPRHAVDAALDGSRARPAHRRGPRASSAAATRSSRSCARRRRRGAEELLRRCQAPLLTGRSDRL